MYGSNEEWAVREGVTMGHSGTCKGAEIPQARGGQASFADELANAEDSVEGGMQRKGRRLSGRV